MITQGFNLEFEFAENPYFEESVLKKSYSVDDMFEPMEEPTLTNVTGCEPPPLPLRYPPARLTPAVAGRGRTKITWKAGKDLTVQSVKKDSSISTEPAASFFSFFEPPSIEFADEGDMQEVCALAPRVPSRCALPHPSAGQAQDRMQQLEMDFRVGVVIYQSLVPKACQWFTGEAAADQSDDEFDEEDEEDDEDEDDDDDDDGDEGEDGEDKVSHPSFHSCSCDALPHTAFRRGSLSLISSPPPTARTPSPRRKGRARTRTASSSRRLG